MEAPTGQAAARSMELGCIDPRNVLTTDARRIGQISGFWIDVSTWTVTSMVVNLEKDILEEMNIKKPLFRSTKAVIPINLIKSISDVVQLNTELSGLMGILAQFNP